jgi:hypothetical protein
MSVDRDKPREPFLPASDLDESDRARLELVDDDDDDLSDEPADSEPATLDDLRQEMRKGFRAVRKGMDALGVRVVKLEADAAWKRWALQLARAAVPFVAGYLTHKYPELAKHLAKLPDILNGLQ